MTNTAIMNQKFNFKIDELLDGDPSKENKEYSCYRKFETPGNIRNLVLIWPDGRQKNCNYAYLVTTEYLPEEGKITLFYTSETIMLIGVNLAELHHDLRYQLPEEIIAVDKRYLKTLPDGESAVFTIMISE